MSEAHSFPAVHTRRFYVTPHAVERLVERLKEAPRREHQPDLHTLGNFLDLRVSAASDAGHVEEVLDMGRPTRVVELTAEDVGDLYAVVRRNEHGAQPEWAVITVLSGAMREASLRRGAWKPVAADLMPAPVPLRETPPAFKALGNLTGLMPGVAAPPVQPTVMTPPVLAVTHPVASQGPSAEPASWLLTWTSRDGVERSHRATLREDVRDTATRECLTGARDFRLHVEVPLTVRRHVDVEF